MGSVPPSSGPSRTEVDRLLTGAGAPFEMETITVGGAPVRVYRRAEPHLGALLAKSRTWGSREYIVHGEERLTYAQHYAAVARLATDLVGRHGVRKGDRVAIAMRNLPEWSISFWAAVAIGAIAVPLNAWWTGPELEFAVRDCGAKVAIVDSERYQRLAPLAGSLRIGEILVARALEPMPDGRPLASIIAPDPDGGAQAAVALPIRHLEPDDPATIFYTSGTTGLPKGALNTHRAICTFLLNASVARARAFVRAGGDVAQIGRPHSQQSVTLVTVPLFHVIGCYGCLVLALAAGGRLVFMNKWDPEDALALIERESVNALTGVPTIVLQALAVARKTRRNLSSMQAIAYSGAPASANLVEEMKDLLPACMPGHSYGLTEATGLVSAVWGRDYADHPGSVGYPMPTVDVKIVGPDDAVLPTGEAGEILVRSVGVIRSYWNNPQATKEAVAEGWLRTGDLGRLDDDGFLYIVDRAKDMIIRGGENIYSTEVENALQTHPDVVEAAVVGLPHHSLGEEVAAVVYAVTWANLTEDDLKAYLQGRLAAFKIPVRIEVRGTLLPRNPTGKLLKSQLRSELVGDAQGKRHDGPRKEGISDV